MVEVSGDWQGMIFKDSQNSKILNKLSLKKKCFPSKTENKASISALKISTPRLGGSTLRNKASKGY